MHPKGFLTTNALAYLSHSLQRKKFNDHGPGPQKTHLQKYIGCLYDLIKTLRFFIKLAAGNLIKLIMLFVSRKNKLARLFVPDKPRKGSLIFESNTESLPGGAPG